MASHQIFPHKKKSCKRQKEGPQIKCNLPKSDGRQDALKDARPISNTTPSTIFQSSQTTETPFSPHTATYLRPCSYQHHQPQTLKSFKSYVRLNKYDQRKIHPPYCEFHIILIYMITNKTPRKYT